ncbi:hypothetical protein L596_013332 [Steinernema carpocapsae]|uniref:Uncharacterized protein n=1 Tax=Steinernema carpocapsae TaxID=34508 RepID=A0A4U5P005_STECR|nr:hypothetical protein L596_013332 [Steinernema carpocapsae]
MTIILEGEYTSSDSGETDGELEQLTQNPIVTTEKPEPELIVFGESAMRYRIYAQGAGLIRKRPVVINGVDYPRNRSSRVLHGFWPVDITRSWTAGRFDSRSGGGGFNGGGYGGSGGGGRSHYDFSDRQSRNVNWQKQELSAVKKDFYVEAASVTSRSDREVIGSSRTK